MAMSMMKVVVMQYHDEYLPNVMFININVIFMYDHEEQYEYLPDVM